jgi:hypothetical protein
MAKTTQQIDASAKPALEFREKLSELAALLRTTPNLTPSLRERIEGIDHDVDDVQFIPEDAGERHRIREKWRGFETRIKNLTKDMLGAVPVTLGTRQVSTPALDHAAVRAAFVADVEEAIRELDETVAFVQAQSARTENGFRAATDALTRLGEDKLGRALVGAWLAAFPESGGPLKTWGRLVRELEAAMVLRLTAIGAEAPPMLRDALRRQVT